MTQNDGIYMFKLNRKMYEFQVVSLPREQLTKYS